ncbi:hypothetical protein CEXT_730151 [Caerostris extrusa]|uniref:Uncharacterized protein n=1 Tax=Caerostris extrusa TaxID=172846 RepID=A0AAV4N6C3_CAEEX|nr:hypothetical protein CEXT_730151 [Caerostris extrusa]
MLSKPPLFSSAEKKKKGRKTSLHSLAISRTTFLTRRQLELGGGMEPRDTFARFHSNCSKSRESTPWRKETGKNLLDSGKKFPGVMGLDIIKENTV